MSTSTPPAAESPTQSPLQGRRPVKRTLIRRKKVESSRADALQAAQDLYWLADNSDYWRDPDNKELLRDLYRLADKVRKDASPISDESVKEVLRAIKYEYCQTIDDLREHVYITIRQIKSILDRLETEGVINRGPVNNRPGPRQGSFHLTGKRYKDWVL